MSDDTIDFYQSCEKNCAACGLLTTAPSVRTAFDFAPCAHCGCDSSTSETLSDWRAANSNPQTLNGSIDEIINNAQEKFSALYESGVDFKYQQMTYALTQLKLLQIQIHSITSAEADTHPLAADFLRAGLKHMDDRARIHDKPNGERSMAKTVAAFNIICDSSITEEQGWMFMGLLKKVRSVQGFFNKDNYEDEASYSALRGECAARARA